MFSFVMLLVAVQVKPYRDRPNNQLLALSQMNLFLFLWTGLLLQTNPEGITRDQILFSVIVGILTTSIVAFTAYLFARELMWQLMAALREVDEEEAAEELEWELADEEADDNCHDPTVGLTPPGPPTRGGRLTLRFAVVIALTLGLGLGLNSDVADTVGPLHTDPVSRFTLVLAREALPGNDKLQVTVNGTIPGPTLRVPAGNRVEVTVINNIFDDASVMHWHGMQQRGSPYMDGVVGVTQCPISNAPGYNTMVYNFLPDRAGTFWCASARRACRAFRTDTTHARCCEGTTVTITASTRTGCTARSSSTTAAPRSRLRRTATPATATTTTSGSGCRPTFTTCRRTSCCPSSCRRPATAWSRCRTRSW